MKAMTVRAKAWISVRFNDNKGFMTKINKKLNFPNESRREMYYFSVKCVELGMRGFTPTFVSEKKKKFQNFREVLEGLELKPLPEGYQSFSGKKKRGTLKKLADEFDDQLAAAMSCAAVQGADLPADYSYNMEVGACSAPSFDMSLREDVDMQVNNPGQIQVDEVRAAAPNPDLGNILSDDASLQNVACTQWDNYEGWPPSQPPVPPEDDAERVIEFFKDLMKRKSRCPGLQYEWSEEAFRSFLNQLELLEGSTHLRSRQDEFLPPLPDFSAYEDVTILPSMEGREDDEFLNNLLISP